MSRDFLLGYESKFPVYASGFLVLCILVRFNSLISNDGISQVMRLSTSRVAVKKGLRVEAFLLLGRRAAKVGRSGVI